MDALQAIATSIGVIGLILLMVLLVLHFFGPKTAAWIHSNREEKIGFSKNQIYNANGYLIQSSSEFLLNSTGSFKRFESIDRDYKPGDQPTQTPSPTKSPSWIQIDENNAEIPPQPLRPAPKSPTFREHKKSLENSPQKYPEALSQFTFDADGRSTVIPRPVTKRQFSSPANCGVAHINLSDVVAKINNGPKSCTNPFLNGSLSISEDDNSNSINLNVNKIQYNVVEETQIIDEKLHKNPFARRRHDDITFFSFPSNGNIVDSQSTNTTSNIKITEIPDTLIELDETLTTTTTTTTAIGTNSSAVTLNNAQNSQNHNRSLSDTGSNTLNGDIYGQSTATTNPFAVAGNLHKTVSDTYLEQYSTQKKQITGTFSRTPSRQSIHNATNEQANSPQTQLNHNDTELKRAMSCDSVNSESSVLLADLEQQPTMPTVTGLLCVGLQYDKNTLTDEGIELVLTVMEAKELIGPPDAEQFDTFVRIYMVPDETVAQQTKLFRNSRCPSYNETISFWLSNKRPTKRRTLWFHVYHSGNVHTLIGETEFQIGDVRRPITTWLTLSDSRHNNSPYGELMFSLSYLPTAERLTVVVVKGRNLKLNEGDAHNSQQSVFVKVYLQKDDKKVSKKKTSVKRADRGPIYNEAIIFSVPPYMLNAIQIRLTVMSIPDTPTSIENSNTIGSAIPIGHVIVGCSSSEKGLRHWNQMLTSLRKPVAMWHPIRRTSPSTVQTG